jgi:GNAT superfamily N-acetyltransferase
MARGTEAGAPGQRQGRGRGTVRLRRRPRTTDLEPLRRLVEAVGVFNSAERAIALELLEERLSRGRASGYEFILADVRGHLAGYCAYGAIPLTRASFDLYWIVVDPAHQGLGLGRKLLLDAERAVHARGGEWLYIETSSRREYARTRRFYLLAAYREVARLRHFYAPNDHKVVFCKRIK